MNILGIDYGKKKIGLATGDTDSKLAEPHMVIEFKSVKDVSKKISRVIQEKKIEMLVVGISRGEMANEAREFGKLMGRSFNIGVVFQDETLSTRMANDLSIEAGINRAKRKSLEDSYSATLILQDYLDSLHI